MFYLLPQNTIEQNFIFHQKKASEYLSTLQKEESNPSFTSTRSAFCPDTGLDRKEAMQSRVWNQELKYKRSKAKRSEI